MQKLPPPAPPNDEITSAATTKTPPTQPAEVEYKFLAPEISITSTGARQDNQTLPFTRCPAALLFLVFFLASRPRHRPRS